VKKVSVEKMVVSGNGEGENAEAKVKAHICLLFKGFHLILDLFSEVQKAMKNVILPEDIVGKLEKVLNLDRIHRGKRTQVAAVDEGQF
jgi:predicted ABC-type transport system involved in lysophospholipase L1 biosynthesis ATPase subunit